MIKLIVLMVLTYSFAHAASSDYNRANSAAQQAFKDLDCDFDDCTKEEVKPQVVYKDKVVEVEKVIEVEKVVYKDRPTPKVPNENHEKAIVDESVTYNKAYFDVHAKSQAPILDFITFSPRASFNIEQYVDTVNKIKEKGTKVYIHGSIEVPESIKTDVVYINAGEKYNYSYYHYWKKEIFYNGSSTKQNSDYFLVDVKKDAQGMRYVDYKIYILLDKPWKVLASEENVAPNTFKFSMAPKVRGFKEKFVPAKIFIRDDS